MSDGPTKLAPPHAPPLDEIILGEDEPGLDSAPGKRRSSPDDSAALAKAIEAGASDERISTRPRERRSNRPKTDPGRDARDPRKRPKMTLRIPDDEVTRPSLPATSPVGGMPAAPPASRDARESAEARDSGSGPMRAHRIVPVGDPPTLADLADADDHDAPTGKVDRTPRRAPGIDTSQEAGWTPYQPTVADRAADARSGAARGPGVDAHLVSRPMREPARTILDEPGMGAMAAMRHHEEPVSEDIPVDTDDVDDPAETPRRLPSALDSEEISVDEGDRVTDPGDVPEVAAEDLVSVETLPGAHSPPPLKAAAPVAAAKAPTATSLMAGVSPSKRTGPGSAPSIPVASPSHAPPQERTAVPPPVTPVAQGQSGQGGQSGQSNLVAAQPSAPLAPNASAGASVAASASGATPPPAPVAPANVSTASSQSPAAAAAPAVSAPPPHVSSPPKPSGEQHARRRDSIADDRAALPPAPGAPMARPPRAPGGPFNFLPPMGVLAPPPMSETAANRKKTRPWWEDLFNDDFIRTMAKITDGDIARETNFIEESLGCEAGATILDLACGTGRHAVELASRGYQVVGFDLSLAMLARASDEAQDRNQKINFVQGDMRDMTFEETFDGVYSWNTSFGFFDEEKNAAVIAKVHRALKKGGQFLLDVVNRDNLIRQAPSLAWFEGDGCICMDEMQIDFITSRMKVKRTLMMDDGRTKEIEYSIRVYSLHELGKMLHDNGFRVAEVSGRTGTPGVFFGCESPRTLILAEKR